MEKQKMITVTVPVDPDTHRKLTEAAKKDNRSKAGLIRALLERHFTENNIE